MDFLPGPTLDNLDRCLLDLEDWLEQILSFTILESPVGEANNDV